MSAPQRMTREQAIARVVAGIGADLLACRDLLELLERQFDAVLRHRSAQLCDLAAEIGAALEAIELRRAERVTLVRALLGADGSVAALAASLAPGARAALAADWGHLELVVLECKRLNTRNGTLLADQYSIMQRVLHGEEALYAPA